MEILTVGHKYLLKGFESEQGNQTIQFIEKQQEETFEVVDTVSKFTKKLVTVNDGTTNEEVIEMLIDRLNYLQSKFPCKENACAITHLQEANMWLYERTRKRISQGVEGKQLEHK